jgi:hypothetical protein
MHTEIPVPPVNAPGVGHDRRATRRRAAGERARWLAARTRNAARHGLLIGAVGSAVMLAALATFVLVPRRVDRSLAAALATLPPVRDTVQLQRALLQARADADSVAMLLQRARRAAAGNAALPLARLDADTTSRAPGVMLADSARQALAPRAPALPVTDSLTVQLQALITRARQAPLVDSYRAITESPLMQGDARLRVLMDSIEQVHREREAYAALGGPDARYALLTSRLTQLGQRVVQLADAQLDARRSDVQAEGTARGEAPAPLIASAPLVPDSVLANDVEQRKATLTRASEALDSARLFNASVARQRAVLRDRMQMDIPPLAMLFAALVLGVASGFGLALLRELRRPTVGDAPELEMLTRARVIVHAGGARRVGAGARPQRRDDPGAPVLQGMSDAWPLLHLALTRIGDEVRQVQVLADQPLLAGAVALNLAAIAARESRATALVDAAHRAGAVVPLLPAAALRAGEGAPVTTASHRWDGSRTVSLGRDASLQLVLPRRTRHDRPDDGDAGRDELARLIAHVDFTVYVSDEPAPAMLDEGLDVVLCARPGVTPLAWLAHAVSVVHGQGRRLRAVLLWADTLPLAH